MKLFRNSVFKSGSKKTFIDYCQLWDECECWEDSLHYFLTMGSINPDCLKCDGLVEVEVEYDKSGSSLKVKAS